MKPAAADTRPLVVHLVHRFSVGGLENGVVNLINGLPAERWRHAVVALTEVDDAFARRIQQRIEAHAPGFSDLIVARHIFTPPSLEDANANLVMGDVGGGTAQLHQQLVLRPTAGLGRPETPIRGLYLASASAHPGGGVHGACGANAARAALAHDRVRLR